MWIQFLVPVLKLVRMLKLKVMQTQLPALLTHTTTNTNTHANTNNRINNYARTIVSTMVNANTNASVMLFRSIINDFSFNTIFIGLMIEQKKTS